MTGLIVFAFTSVFGWVLVGMGLSSRRQWRQRDETETLPAEAVVVDHIEKKSSGRGRTSYHLPVVRYTVDGTEYLETFEFAYDPKDLPVGTALRVLCDPRDPARFHPDLQELRHGSTHTLMTVGLIWILLSALFVLVMNSISSGYGLDIIDSLGLRGFFDRLWH